MRLTRPQLLRLATVVVFILAALAATRLVTATHASKKVESVAPEPGTLDVHQALLRLPPGDVALRGFLFEGGGGGVRLCYQRRPASPPLCGGPFVDVYNLDLKPLPMHRRVVHHVEVKWLDQPVTLYGTLLGTAFTATGIAS